MTEVRTIQGGQIAVSRRSGSIVTWGGTVSSGLQGYAEFKGGCMEIISPWRIAIAGAALCSLSCGYGYAQEQQTQRRVAITFDDLPGVAMSGDACNASVWRSFTARLLHAIEESDIPALGLVTGSRVCDALRPELLPQLLREWLRSGHDLGNHSFSHRDLNSTPVRDYIEDIVRNGELVRPIAAAEGREFKYFRYPFLHSGTESASKSAVQLALAELGYINAPVTIDNQEWVFAAVYARAKARGETALAERIAVAYVQFMRDVFIFFERYSLEVLGYEPAQILLVHANEINADYLRELTDMLRSRGYTFVSIDDALQDEAYRRADDYVGPVGYSWLHRWGISAGIPFQAEPREPQWIADLHAEN